MHQCIIWVNSRVPSKTQLWIVGIYPVRCYDQDDVVKSSNKEVQT